VLKRHATLIALAALAAINLAPLATMLVMGAYGAAAEGGEDVLGGPWVRLWHSAPLFGRWMANSALVAGFTVAWHLAADSLAGYVLAKRPFRGRAVVFALVVASLTIPRQVTLIPLFLGFARLGLYDTYAGLILPGLGDVIGIFLMRQFFITMPDSLLEAARIDGAGEWRLYWHVALPMARPALGVLAILAFQHYWSDFFWPLVATQSHEHYTIQVGLAFLARSEFGPDLPLMAAGTTAASLPILIVFLFMKRHLFEGWRAGALRG
jgi:ABC-type glycerol-3-phosphate transport system permease component